MQFLTHASLAVLALCAVGYLVASFVSWYLLAGLNYSLNSGQLGRHWLWFPLQCFAEEFLCFGLEANLTGLSSSNRGAMAKVYSPAQGVPLLIRRFEITTSMKQHSGKC